ncbi:MAG: thioredoxin family protein [Bacteroidales bacterium]|nr:thioredoxin family protein [Bacteroidales bacterium]
MKKIICFLTVSILILSGCTSRKDNSDINRIKIVLSPQIPGESSSLRWSPKGEKLTLLPHDEGVIAELLLGPMDLSPIRLLMKKSEGSLHYDLLDVDLNRDGEFGGPKDTLLICTPKESRGKTWSSFSVELQVPFKRMKNQKSLVNPYPVSFWYVEDPEAENPELAIRFSRRGWMEGHTESEFGNISILITEREMDGVFDRNDSWAIAPDSSLKDLYSSKHSKSMDSHAWFGEQAFGIDSVLSSGRVVWIKPVDPQITREEEERQNDWLAPDKAAKRSGKMVKFLHDYQYAKDLAKQKGQKTLLDFETTWCGPCNTMDQYVYTADTVISATKNLTAVKIDGDEHRDLVKKYNISGYPTLVLLDKEGTEIARGVGYQSVAKVLELVAKK